MASNRNDRAVNGASNLGARNHFITPGNNVDSSGDNRPATSEGAFVDDDDTKIIEAINLEEARDASRDEREVVEEVMQDPSLGAECKDFHWRFCRSTKVTDLREANDSAHQLYGPRDNLQIYDKPIEPIPGSLKIVNNMGRDVPIEIGTNLELQDGNICHVTRIFETCSRDRPFRIRGVLLCRSKRLAPMLPDCDSELYWHVEMVKTPGGLCQYHKFIDIAYDSIKGVKKVIFTNKSFKTLNESNIFATAAGSTQNTIGQALFCRWIYVKVFEKPEKTRVVSFQIRSLSTCDLELLRTSHDHFVSNELLRAIHGPDWKLGGSFTTKEGQQQYVLNDMFSGTGGASTGGRDAGLAVTMACDNQPAMMRSYRAVFGDKTTFRRTCDIFHVATSWKSDYATDVLHISFPCQMYSAAKTVARKKFWEDEDNEAASYCINKLGESSKPRIVTLENTKGLLTHHFPQMCFIFSQLLDQHYSLRFGVLASADYGVPQLRERLIVIAAAPGNPLPDLPPPSHSKDPVKTGLLPYTTIYQAIDPIPRNAPNHEKDYYAEEEVKTAYDGDKIGRTITCKGPDPRHHPNGFRPLTVREAAVLQTFKHDHPFGTGLTKTRLMQQIGNAVPPLLAKKLFLQIRNTLQAFDITEEARLEAEQAYEMDGFVETGSQEVQR